MDESTRGSGSKFPLNDEKQNWAIVGGVGIIVLGFLLALLGEFGDSAGIIAFGGYLLPLGQLITGGGLIFKGVSGEKQDQIYRAALIIGGAILLNILGAIGSVMNII